MNATEPRRESADHEIETLRDDKLDAVTGGSGMLGSAIKAIGEGLSTMARKG
jgi:hypothetical protein